MFNIIFLIGKVVLDNLDYSWSELAQYSQFCEKRQYPNRTKFSLTTQLPRVGVCT